MKRGCDVPECVLLECWKLSNESLDSLRIRTLLLLPLSGDQVHNRRRNEWIRHLGKKFTEESEYKATGIPREIDF